MCCIKGTLQVDTLVFQVTFLALNQVLPALSLNSVPCGILITLPLLELFKGLTKVTSTVAATAAPAWESTNCPCLSTEEYLLAVGRNDSLPALSI